MDKKVKSIYWLSSHPNIYNDYLFRKISCSGINLKVYFNSQVKETHPWKSQMGIGFNNKVISKRFGLDWKLIYNVIKSTKNEIYLIAGWNQINFFVVTLILGILNKPFIFWTDTPNNERYRGVLKYHLRNLYLKFLSRKVTYFLVTGNYGIIASRKLGIPNKKIINFPFATDIKYFSPRKTKLKDSTNIKFVSIGRLQNDHKGHDLAIKAFALLFKKGYTNFEYYIAGEGANRDVLERLIFENNLNNNIKLLGWLEPSEILALYNNADILLHTSHFDPFPNAVLEGMASGLIVIGSDQAGSVRDRVVNGVNGYIHQSGNTLDIVSKIESIFQNTSQLKQMKIEARKTAEHWDVNYHIRTLKTILKSISI